MKGHKICSDCGMDIPASFKECPYCAKPFNGEHKLILKGIPQFK